jgi:transposase
MADQGYDRDAIAAQAEKPGMAAVIPSRRNLKKPRDYDRARYKLRHLVENAFRIFKQWCGIATRYAKKEASFLAAGQIRDMVMWTRLF